MWRVLTRMAEGRAQKREIDMLLDVTKQVEGHTICALGDAAAWPIQGLIAHFRHEIEERIDQYAANPHSEPVAWRRSEHDEHRSALPKLPIGGRRRRHPARAFARAANAALPPACARAGFGRQEWAVVHQRLVRSIRMSSAERHLAQFNIARITYPLDDPRMREFVDNVDARERAGRQDRRASCGGCRTTAAMP